MRGARGSGARQLPRDGADPRSGVPGGSERRVRLRERRPARDLRRSLAGRPRLQQAGGNHRKGRGGNEVLKRVLYQSAFSSMRGVPEPRALYDPQTRGGQEHAQAVIT
jgi:hypothetical protein